MWRETERHDSHISSPHVDVEGFEGFRVIEALPLLVAVLARSKKLSFFV